MTSPKFKSSEILKVNGVTFTEGNFVGHDGKNQKRPINFTPELIGKIYENISSHIPIYIGHDDTPTRKPVGYAFKFGMSPDGKDITYDGFVFDADAREKISTLGYNKVSPEVEVEYGVDGGCVDAGVTGLCFVPKPAISGTEAQMGIAVFSKVDENKDREGKTMKGIAQFDDQAGSASAAPASTPSGVSTPAALITPPAASTPTAPADSGITPEDVAALRLELAEARAAREAEKVKNEKLMSQRVEETIAEVKGLGFENPAEIVKGLSAEQKLAVLSKLKATAAKNQQIAQGSSHPGSAPEGNKQKTEKDQAALLESTLKELGMTVEEYNKLCGGK